MAFHVPNPNTSQWMPHRFAERCFARHQERARVANPIPTIEAAEYSKRLDVPTDVINDAERLLVLPTTGHSRTRLGSQAEG